jgi:hypothetical protein
MYVQHSPPPALRKTRVQSTDTGFLSRFSNRGMPPKTQK